MLHKPIKIKFRYIYLIGIVSVLLQNWSCGDLTDKKNTAKVSQEPHSQKDSSMASSSSEIPASVVIDTIRVACTIQVNAVSVDSVHASVILKNASNRTVALYKSRLPNDSSALVTFVVLDKNSKNLTRVNKNHIDLSKSFEPVLLSKTHSDDFLNLKPGQSALFK